MSGATSAVRSPMAERAKPARQGEGTQVKGDRAEPKATTACPDLLCLRRAL